MRLLTIEVVVLCAIMTVTHQSVMAAGQASISPAATATCRALEKSDFSNVEDAPAQPIKVELVGASNSLPDLCKVEGYVAPQVGIEVFLPLFNWNGKLITVGDGGWAGSFNEEACHPHLRRGYACVTTDAGHKGQGDDGLWARNNLAAQIDFGYRAIYVATLAGKAVIHAYYGSDPKRSYFMSCSTGGYEGLVEAQRFPWDFDGIIAGAPDMDEADLSMRNIWAHRALMDESGKPRLDTKAIEVLHQAALQRCDLHDGLNDGVVRDPTECRVDPSRLLCKAASTEHCLTAAQVEAALRIYDGPPHQAGRVVRGALPGSEEDWLKPWGLDAAYSGADSLFRYMIYGASPAWTSGTYDFERDCRRLGLGALYSATNPDLRHFKAAGGKLLVYQGGTDLLEMPGAIIDYYEMVERVIADRASTQDFFRLFLIPGMNHCTGGAGAYTVDYLTYLENWVEHSQPPDRIIGARVGDSYLATLKLPSSVESELAPDTPQETRDVIAAYFLPLPLDPSIPVSFTRPYYPYPLHARHIGGDPNKAESFRPVGPHAP